MRSVIVTGVSRGIGAALFDEFLAAGDRILALGRRFTADQQAAARARPDRVKLRSVDLSYVASLPGPDEFAALLREADSVALIHNAAVVDPVGAPGTLVAGAIQQAVAVNLTAPMVLTNAVLAAIGDRPLIVLFISTRAAHQPVGGLAVYGATKHGAEFFMQALADQYAGHPAVRVAAFQPGVVDTAMQARLRGASEAFAERDRLVGLHARGELAIPTEVARRIMAEHFGPDAQRPQPGLVTDLTGE